MIADLVRRHVAVIATPVCTAAALAAKAATTTIPIVFSLGSDPVKPGLVASHNRPGGNVTGINFFVSELVAKRLGLMRELVPKANRIGLVVNPGNPAAAEATIKDVARRFSELLGCQIVASTPATLAEIDAAFSPSLGRMRVDGLVVGADRFFNNRRVQLATLASRDRLPNVSLLREFAEAGGLMSYGPNDEDRYRLVGVYAGRVLKGEKPADMPVQQPTAFLLVINLNYTPTLSPRFTAALLNAATSKAGTSR